MRFFTVHTRADRPPVLVTEGFRLAAFIFGPLWLFWHRAFAAAVIAAALDVVIAVTAVGVLRVVLLISLGFLLGLIGNDCRRFALARRGFELSDIVAARNAEAALARLLEHRPELRASFP